MALSTADAAHLLRRSGFGVTQPALAELTALGSRTAAVDRVLDLSRNAAGAVPTIPVGGDKYVALKTMTNWWIDRMRTSPVPIVEKMTVFWHGHFATGMDKVDMSAMATQHAILRKHALGDFHAMTQAVSRDPAMLLYLDNYANFAGRFQENFARELMELFTMGLGNYTQADVSALTRAWTGHSVDDSYRTYLFRAAYHDNNGKRLFGGPLKNWDGPAALTEILKGVMAVPSSRFVAAKVFSFLAYPVEPGDPVVTPLADAFRASDLNVLALVKAIFNSPAFWSDTARHALVRSPIEWVVAALQASGIPTTTVPAQTVLAQAGQLLFSPPDVSGWGQNEYWLSTSNLWGRSQWASFVRYYAWQAGLLSGMEKLSVPERVQRAFDQFGITEPSPTTRAALEGYCTKALADGDGWSIPAMLVHLLLLSPDLQVA